MNTHVRVLSVLTFKLGSCDSFSCQLSATMFPNTVYCVTQLSAENVILVRGVQEKIELLKVVG